MNTSTYVSGVTATPDIYAEPPEEPDRDELMRTCLHGSVCRMHHRMRGDDEMYASEWCECSRDCWEGRHGY